MANSRTTIAVIPGTGNMGFGFASLFARAGHTVLLGSRDESKAKNAAAKIVAEHPNAKIQAGKTEDLPLSSAEVIVWCLQGSINNSISYLKTFDFKGKIILDSTNVIYKLKDHTTMYGKSSATELEAYPSAKWVAGFKIVPAADLTNPNPQTGTSLYSDNLDALNRIKQLVEDAKYPIAKTGPLVGARDDETWIWEFCKTLPQEVKQRFSSLYD